MTANLVQMGAKIPEELNVWLIQTGEITGLGKSWVVRTALEDLREKFVRDRQVTIPILGTIAAGSPSDVDPAVAEDSPPVQASLSKGRRHNPRNAAYQVNSRKPARRRNA